MTIFVHRFKNCNLEKNSYLQEIPLWRNWLARLTVIITIAIRRLEVRAFPEENPSVSFLPLFHTYDTLR